MKNAILVLEGGALRCMFTAGVLDVLMEHELEFPTVIGVSAGSLCGLNYLSRQKGRTAQINLEYAADKRFMGLDSLLKTGSVFNFDFLFREISEELLPFDFTTFTASAQRFLAVSTDCRTGEAVFHEKGISEDILLAVRASSSMPLLAPIVSVDGKNCLDGGVAAPVPLEWALRQNCDKIVVVRTRQKGYQKPPVSRTMQRAYERAYSDYPVFLERLMHVPEQYNELQARMNRLERAGEIFVLRPRVPVDVSRVEKNTQKLQILYDKGVEVCEGRYAELLEYLG